MPALELSLDPAALPQLVRVPGMAAGRATPAKLTWFDTKEAALARAGQCLVGAGKTWRIEALHAPGPGQPAPVLAEAGERDALPGLPAGLDPIARLEGRRRVMRHGATTVTVLSATPPGVAPLVRLWLDGAAPDVAQLAAVLAGDLPITVPLVSLSAGLLAARDIPEPPPARQLRPGQDTRDALADVVGGLASMLLRWSAEVTGASPEPVHQMRVAIRRLRSALTVFRPAAGCAELDALRTALHGAAGLLGAARDWDVFLGGIGARMGAAVPGDRRVAALLRAAGARHGTLYAEVSAFLSGPEFRRLAVDLAAFAALRPWPEAPHEDVADFAVGALDRRARKVRRAGRGIAELPLPELHELRKECKRLRYTADFFAPVFPGRPVRRYVRRLAKLQEELGQLNDSAAVPGLLAQLGRLRGGYAAGLAEGFANSLGGPARDRIEACWKRFRKAERFWSE